MRSIRRDLTFKVVSRVLPLIVLGSAAVYVGVRQVVLRGFDAALRNEMQVLAAAAERVGDGVDFDYGPEREGSTAFDEGLDFYFQASLNDGSLLKKSASLHDQTLSMKEGEIGKMRIGPVVLPSGKMGRGCVYTTEPRVVEPSKHNGPVDRPDAPLGPVHLIIAATTGDIDRPLVALAFAELLVSLVLLTATVVALQRGVRAGLAPLDDLARQVRSIEPGNLTVRIEESTQPEELTAVALRLNDLLARVEEAFARERRFTANAAHELRTPIAEIRAIAEVTAGSEDDSERMRGLAEIVKVCEEMHSTISTLLAIARAKSGTLQVQPREVDLSAFLLDWCSKRKAGKADGHQKVACMVAPGLRTRTDPVVLASVINNLLDNAVAYTPHGGAIEARAESTAEGARLVIENTCVGLAEADLRDMFDPFWRKRGTTIEGSHSGLGLALVRALCDALGATVWAQLAAPNRLAVSVLIPAGSGSVGVNVQREPILATQT